jgi:YfiH family protein
VDPSLLRSALLPAGFRHGFTTRLGGISEGAFRSFNFGGAWGDDPAAVRENRRRLYAAAEITRLLSVVQVHGAEVHVVEPGQADEASLAGIKADALCARGLPPDTALGVYSADCTPILFADPATGAVAAAHAGWRGTVAGVAAATVRALERAFDVRPEDLHVAFGPSIGPCCFEVGDEVAALFPPEVVRLGASPRGRPLVDVRAANRAALRASGVRADRIDAEAPCTACRPERFFSFRRDGRPTGQHIAFIAGPR